MSNPQEQKGSEEENGVEQQEQKEQKETIFNILLEDMKKNPPKKHNLSNELRAVLGCLSIQVLQQCSFDDHSFDLYNSDNPRNHTHQLLLAQRTHILAQVSNMSEEKKDHIKAVYIIFNEATNNKFDKRNIQNTSPRCRKMIVEIIEPVEEHLNPSLKGLLKECKNEDNEDILSLISQLESGIDRMLRQL